MAAHAVPKPEVIPMGIMGVLVRAGLVGISGYLWWNYNVVYGNAVAIETLGLFSAVPSVARQYLIPVAGSISQLYWDENFDFGVLRHPMTGIFCVVVGILDILGPAYGFLITQGYEFTLGNIIFSLLWAFFFSIACQEVAWRTTKDIVLWIKSQITRTRIGGRGRGGGHGGP